MMSTKKLNTSSVVTADHPKGRQATDVFRAQYNNAALDERRAQVLNEDKAFAAALRAIIERHSMPIAAPQGGRIHIVRISVSPNRDWANALEVAGPDVGINCYVRKVGSYYPAQDGQTEDREVILVSFGGTIPNGQYALDWAKPLGLKPADPRTVFAIGEHKPTLHRDVGVNSIAVVSLTPCDFEGHRRVPGVRVHEVYRRLNLYWFDKAWNDDYWFALIHE